MTQALDVEQVKLNRLQLNPPFQHNNLQSTKRLKQNQQGLNPTWSFLGVGKNIDSAMHRDSFPCNSISIQQSSESIQAPGQWGRCERRRSAATHR